ncbi:hypothetical protein D4764_04G0010630 [Takifugu flavidus]|uniref:Uncharacterized protein n=1 Tax=Takifugu flavidus TaxID=433684 RepID=A0A5C6N538_9TELE|nr:hypothetical protein D4764_04G0010630 [Takifugu flavidus]
MTVRLSTRITADAAPIHLSIFRSILLSLMNKILRYLNSSTRGRTSSRTRRRHSTFFRVRTMDSDFEVLIHCEPPQHVLEILARWCQKNYIIRKKQRRDILPTELKTLHFPGTPRNSVHKSYGQNR